MDELEDMLLELWRRVRKASHQMRRSQGLGMEHYLVLKDLARHGPRSVGELAERMGIASSSMTVASQHLEARGLVRRQRRTEDERVVDVILTDAGRDVVHAWWAAQRHALSSLLLKLEPTERQVLQSLLQRMLDEETSPSHEPDHE
jgi:DNA-binding MarR family transcriptional regulator